MIEKKKESEEFDNQTINKVVSSKWSLLHKTILRLVKHSRQDRNSTIETPQPPPPMENGKTKTKNQTFLVTK